MERTKATAPASLGSQMIRHQTDEATNKKRKKKKYDGDGSVLISTGSTLLDLAISGGRFHAGGLPLGIFVEIFGPSGAGKTVLLCQIAGNVQKLNGDVMFHDPEARLNKQFARMFGLDISDISYKVSNTVTDVFENVREWETENTINGIFADSLAALSTDMEMNPKTGDKMGMRRAKEFSEELRKTCRILTQNNLLMVCSNQVRQNLDAGPYGQKVISPGGEAIGFYASLRLRCKSPVKIKEKHKIGAREYERTIGVSTKVEVFKSSIWKPFREETIEIIYDYGVDDIRCNLKCLKTNTGAALYKLNGRKLGKGIDHAFRMVEEEGLEEELKEAVIELWNEIESHFQSERKPRME